MAAAISQQPNLYNGAYVPNVWVLDGLTTEDRYVLNVRIDGTTVSTIKQPANPEGVGIFDVQKIVQSYLNPEFLEETTFAADTPGALMSYQIEYGTETGTAVEIDGTSTTKFVINSYDNWRVVNQDLTDFLPNPGEITCENANVSPRYSSTLNWLTNYPEDYKVRSNEYKTLSFFSTNTNIGPNWGPNEAPFFVYYKYYNAAGSLVTQSVYTLATAYGSSLRSNCQDMTVTQTNDNRITTIGVGPQNQQDGGITWNPVWASYEVTVHAYDHCLDTTISDCLDIGEILGDGYLGDTIYQANFTVDDECQRFDPVTVSFVNQYGVKDYMDFTKRNTSTTNTTRNNYTKATGSWSSDSFTIDQHGRGKTTFSSAATTRVTVTTDWMEDSVSEWLQELYTSPSVQIYINGQWEPCNITTSSYSEKTFARNMLFQHELAIEYSNNQKIQRG